MLVMRVGRFRRGPGNDGRRYGTGPAAGAAAGAVRGVSSRDPTSTRPPRPRRTRGERPTTAPCCRTRSLHMTASVTMRMWHSVSSAFWRPDPRRIAEPREPSYADETPCRDRLPRRFRSSTLRACGAGRLALEQIRQRGLPRPWVNPRMCARGCRRGSGSYPQFRCTNLPPSLCTDPGGQHPPFPTSTNWPPTALCERRRSALGAGLPMLTEVICLSVGCWVSG